VPLRVSQLKGKTRELAVKIPDEDEPVVIQYVPGELTLEVSDKIKEAVETGFEGDVAGIVLEPVIKGWDLIQEDGSPLPCNTEQLKKIPLHVLAVFMTAIQQDMMPDPEKSVISESTSPSTGERDGSRTGSLFNEQPIDLAASRGNS
jgi:Pyridoxal phosphate biosynthesis protein